MTELAYFDATDFDATDGVKEGYLQRKTIDPGGLAITTHYEVNEVGIPMTVIHPRAAGVTDGRFRTHVDVNALNQVTRTVTSPPFSYETRSFYDRNNMLERVERDVKDENGAPLVGGVEVRRFCYDEQFNLVQESVGSLDPATHLITRHRYNESDKRIRTIRPRGNEVRWSYDERLLPVSMVRGASSPDASTTRTGYSADGLKIRSVDGRGNVTRYAYDAFNHLVQTTDPLGNISRLDYDKSGNVVVERFFEAQSDGTYLLLARSEYEFDELNHRIAEKTNLFRAPQPATDPETDFLASPGPGDVLLTQTFYDKKGRVVRIVNALGQPTFHEYDTLDRKIVERDALGNFTRFTYDPNSNLVRSDTHEQVTDVNTSAAREEVFSALYEYDELDRRVSTTDGLGNTTRFSYDSRNSLIRQVDPLGNVKRFEYDVYGRRFKEKSEQTVTGLGGGSLLPTAMTRSEYDDNGNLVAFIDARGNRTEQEFDALDRRTILQYPDATTQRFQYDPDDDIIADQDNNGLRRLYIFDALQRMTRMDLNKSGLAPGITVEGASFAQFGYDAVRRVILERNDFAETRAQVDSLGRRYEETVSLTAPATPPLGPLTVHREFDNLGNVTQLTYPGGRVVRYHPDDLNRIERIENVANGQDYPGSTTIPATYEILHHQYRGLRKRRTLLGNGASTTYDYDGNVRIIQIAHVAPGESLILQHLYDAAGNMRLKNDVSPAANRGEAYKYDSFYWLTKLIEATNLPVFDPADFGPADTPKPRNQLDGQARIDAVIGPLAQDSADFTFRYDVTGNREEEREPGQSPILYATNILNQYAAVRGQAFSYDRNGNLKDDGHRQYLYDYQNRLVHVHEPSTGQDTQFFYDARGRRICSSEGGQATYLVSDGQNVIEEYRAGVLVAQYVNEYGLDTICQMARREGAAMQGNEYWYHKDLVGSSRMLVDAAGRVPASYRYLPFGELDSPEPVLENPYRFMGRRFDASLEAYDFRAREYVPALGRFLQRDIMPALNLYLFVQNNPLIAIDPMGRERENPASKEAIMLGGSVTYTITAERVTYAFDPSVWITEPEYAQRYSDAYDLRKAQVEAEEWDKRQRLERQRFAAQMTAVDRAVKIFGAPSAAVLSLPLFSWLAGGGLAFAVRSPRLFAFGTAAVSAMAGQPNPLATSEQAVAQKTASVILPEVETALTEATAVKGFGQAETAGAAGLTPKEFGDMWRDTVANGLRKLVPKGWTVSTEEYFPIPGSSGRYLDVVVRDALGKLVGALETKAGASPYKLIQQLKDIKLMEQLNIPIFEYRFPFSKKFFEIFTPH